MSELPKGWADASVGDTGRYINGLAFKPDDWGNEGRPIIRIQNLTNPEKPFNRTQAKFDDEFIVKTGEILVSWSATLDAFLWNREEAVLNQHIFRVVPNDGIDKAFLFHLLREAIAEMRLSEHLHGSTMKHINRGPFLAHPIGLPPLNEQRRIAGRLDAVFEKSRAAKARLERLPALLEKLKRSILAAAFRGDLTKDWRAAHPDVEPASVLLERIRAERRRRWEEGLRAKGKDPKKATYEEPAAIDVAGLPELPEGWAWARLPDLGEMSRGKSRHRPRNDPRLLGDRIPFIQTGEVSRSEGRITAWSAMYSEFGLAQSRVFPAGTVCITIAASIAESGILAFDACFPDSVVGVNVDPRLATPEFVEFFLRTARDDLARFAPATAQANINLEILSDVAVPLPPRAETDEMTRLLDAAFGVLATAMTRQEVGAGRLARLEQAALAKAFRGELVPQDPSDEPASVLLDRIRAARADEPQRGRRGRPARTADPELFAAKPAAPRATNGHGADAEEGEPVELVVAAFQLTPRLTATSIGTTTGLDAASVKKALKALVDGGQVRVEGKARGTAYVWGG